MKNILFVLFLSILSHRSFSQNWTTVNSASAHINKTVNLLGMITSIDCRKTRGGYITLLRLGAAENNTELTVSIINMVCETQTMAKITASINALTAKYLH